MTSQLNVNSIAHSNETTAMTINSSGLVMAKKVAFQVVATDTEQSYTASAYAKITWESVELDTASYWDSTNHRYTPQVAGWYLFGGQVRLKTLSGSVTLVAFNVAKSGNTGGAAGAMMAQFQVDADAFTNGEYPLPTGMMQMNGSTDYVEAYFQSEENCEIHDNSRRSFFWGMLVHPT